MSLMRAAVLRPTKGIKNVNIRQVRPYENAKDGISTDSRPTKKPSFHADYWDMRQYTNILVY